MKRVWLAAFAIALPLVGVYADQLTPTQALERVKSSAPTKQRAYASAGASLVYTAQAKDAALNCFYVFQNAENGYMIVSADDCAEPLLGYVDNGRFDINEISPEMKWWLEEYQRQIEYAVAAKEKAAGQQTIVKAQKKSEATSERASIAPMITTMWNQSDPYNRQTPVLDGGQQAYTGCVATAFAMVMNYYKYPACGTGSVTYETSDGVTYSYDFTQHPFDWDNMLDRYTDDSPEESCDAVATLMDACGKATHMTYFSNSSGTTIMHYEEAMLDYFGYSPAAKVLLRECYTQSEWTDMVYNELAEGRPVFYSGQGDGGGHAFICDGYNGEGYFHFNWGWGGSSNGYFMLNALDPSSLGIGGGTGGYNSGQVAFFGLRPPKDGDQAAYNFYTNSVNTDVESITAGQNVTFWYDDMGCLYNLSAYDYNDLLKLRFTNVETEEVKDVDVNVEFPRGEVIGDVSVSYEYLKSVLDNGEYRYAPMYTDLDGVVKPMHVTSTFPSYMTVIVSDDEIKFVDLYEEADCSVDNLQVSRHMIGQMATTEFDVTSEGLLRGNFYATLLDGSEDDGYSVSKVLGSKVVEVDNTTDHIKLEYTVPKTLEAGDYTYALLFEGEADEDLYIEYLGTISIVAGGVFEVNEFNLESDNGVCERSKIHVSGNVSASGGPVSGALTFYICVRNGDSLRVKGSFNSDVITLEDGESADYDVVGAFEAGEVGTTYYLLVGQNYSELGNNRFEIQFIEDKVPVSQILIDPNTIELAEGEEYTIHATVLPENADNKELTWTVSNPTLASIAVDSLDSSVCVVTLLGSGNVTVTASSTDGSGVTATFDISIASGVKSLNSETARVDVYTTTGVQVLRNASAADLKALTPGLYIVNNRKLVIK